MPSRSSALQTLEQHALVRHVLIEKEHLVVGGRDDERLLHLAEHAPEQGPRVDRRRRAEEGCLLGHAAVAPARRDAPRGPAHAHVGNDPGTAQTAERRGRHDIS